MKRFKKEIIVRYEDINVGDKFSRYGNGISWVVEEKDDAQKLIKTCLYVDDKKADLIIWRKAEASIFTKKKA